MNYLWHFCAYDIEAMSKKNPDFGLKWPVCNNTALYLVDVDPREEIKNYDEGYVVAQDPEEKEMFKGMKSQDINDIEYGPTIENFNKHENLNRKDTIRTILSDKNNYVFSKANSIISRSKGRSVIVKSKKKLKK